MRETWVRSLGQKDPLEKEMATHFSTLAWKIPWMEEPGRLHGVAESDTTEQLHYHYHVCIHLSVNGHLGCLHVLAIVNSTS